MKRHRSHGMITRLRRSVVILLGWGLLTCVPGGALPATAQLARHSGEATQAWLQSGLDALWSTQVSTGRFDGRETLTFLHVSSRQKNQAFEVVHDQGRHLFSPEHLGRTGHRLGEQGARHYADVEVRVLATRGITAEIKVHETPRVTLYVQTPRAQLHAIDAETGVMQWQFPTGNPDFPSLAPTANDDFAAVVNGSTLYVVTLADGKLVFDRQVGGAPAAGPAMSAQYVMVPLMGGIVEAYRLEEGERHRPPLIFASPGSAQVQPTVTPLTVSWPTDRGLLCVADLSAGVVKFRLEARSELVATSAYLAPHQLFVATVDGYLLSVAEDNGRMLWQFSAGESLTTAPVAVGDHVYVASERGNLFAVAAATGIQTWQARNIARVVTVGRDRLFCEDLQGQLSILDQESGRRLATLPLGPADQLISNTVSDRIYLLTGTGRVTAFRLRDALWPTIHVTLPASVDAPPAEPDASTPPASAAAPATPAENTDLWETPADDAETPADDDIFSGTIDDIFGSDGF